MEYKTILDILLKLINEDYKEDKYWYDEIIIDNHIGFNLYIGTKDCVKENLFNTRITKQEEFSLEETLNEFYKFNLKTLIQQLLYITNDNEYSIRNKIHRYIKENPKFELINNK